MQRRAIGSELRKRVIIIVARLLQVLGDHKGSLEWWLVSQELDCSCRELFALVGLRRLVFAVFVVQSDMEPPVDCSIFNELKLKCQRLRLVQRQASRPAVEILLRE